MTATPSLHVQAKGGVTTLTIDRPDAFNALNTEVLQGLRDQVLAARNSPECRVVVITGSGQKAFSAGADLKELSGMSADRALEVMQAGQEVMRVIEHVGIPVVAAVNGLALGGGFELVLATTFPILSTRASLGLPESGLGLIPGYGGTQRLPKVIGPKVAAHLMITGTRLDAQRAYDLGLTPIAPVAPDELMTTALEVAETIAAQGPRAVRSILTALEASHDSSIEAGLALETGLAALAIAGAESDEGVAAFLERRPPHFDEPTTEEAR